MEEKLDRRLPECVFFGTNAELSAPQSVKTPNEPMKDSTGKSKPASARVRLEKRLGDFLVDNSSTPLALDTSSEYSHKYSQDTPHWYSH